MEFISFCELNDTCQFRQRMDHMVIKPASFFLVKTYTVQLN